MAIAGGTVTWEPEAAVLVDPDARTAPLGAFLAEQHWTQSLRLLFGPAGPLRAGWNRDAVLSALDREVARIDMLLTAQVNAVLHHGRVQRLEASWRSLRYLVEVAGELENVKIRVLQLTWQELARDLDRALEFDQSQIFHKVYSEEFGMPGGQPYGLLVGDYEVRHRRTAGHPVDDVAVLKGMSQVAAAAFAPFLVGASPSLFGLDDFTDLSQPIDIVATFRAADYARWKALQEAEDARFVGVLLPRVLLRPPYRDDGSRIDGFRFVEEVGTVRIGAHVWGSAAFAFASVVARSFAASGWFIDIRGARRDRPLGGLVADLPVPWFETDRPGLAIKYSTDVSITESQEKDLSDLGFIPLMKVKDTEYSAFYTNQSVQVAARYESLAASINARMSTMLQYILCVSRFAHYLKVLARDRVGSFATAEECETFLQAWLRQYCNASDNASPETMARYPLREGQVRVREPPGRPGIYQCTFHLRPHSQVDQVVSEFRLVTELMPREAA